MIIKISDEIYEIRDFDKLNPEKQREAYNLLINTKPTVDKALAETKVEAYQKILEGIFLELVKSTNKHVLDL